LALITESLKQIQEDIAKIDANQIEINNNFMHNKPRGLNQNSIEVNDANTITTRLNLLKHITIIIWLLNEAIYQYISSPNTWCLAPFCGEGVTS
jgi:hypothetical protein